MENQICLRIDKKEYNYLEQKAKKEDRSISYIIRKLIEKSIENEKLTGDA